MQQEPSCTIIIRSLALHAELGRRPSARHEFVQIRAKRKRPLTYRVGKSNAVGFFPCRANHTALQAFVVRSVSELSSTCVVDSTVISRIQITGHPILLHSNASIQQNLQSSIFDTLLKSCLAKSQCKGRPVCDTERASMECRSRRTTSLVSTFSFGSIAESRARHQTH